MAENFVITIARGFGSGGKEIASKVAKELGVHCYENRILTLASEYSGLDRSRFIEVDERQKQNFIMSKLRELPKTLSPKPVNDKFISDMKMYEYQAEIIKRLAKTESCVIVGKCADHILKDEKNVFSFYIEAPRPYCRQRVMDKMHINEAEANKLITKTDKYRADYYKYYSGGNYWTNPVNYDLTLNSEKIGTENCIELIKQYVALRMENQK